MHSIINKTPSSHDTEHKNGKGLDNQKENLRTATRSQNNQNRKIVEGGTSKYKGVCVPPVGNPCATITLNGKSINLGSFNFERKAALAYDNAAKELFGDFARTNFN